MTRAQKLLELFKRTKTALDNNQSDGSPEQEDRDMNIAAEAAVEAFDILTGSS